QHRRNQHHAIEGNSLLDQIAGKPGGARGAIALADQEQWRVPAIIACEIEADELADGCDIALQAPEFLSQLGVCRPAVAGAHGIDKDQVGHIEPGLVVVHQLERRLRHAAVRQHVHAPRAQRSEVQPYRGRSWAAVEGEHQRAWLASGVFRRISNKEHLRLGFAFRVLDGQFAGGRGVAQNPACNADLVLRYRRRLLAHLRLGFFLLCFFLFSRLFSRRGGWWCGGPRLLGRRSQGQRKQRDQQGRDTMHQLAPGKWQSSHPAGQEDKAFQCLTVATLLAASRVYAAKRPKLRLYRRGLCAQPGVLMQVSGSISRATGRPRTMCSSMISSTSAEVTRPYQMASG